jgi:hypothetical protein
MEKENKYKEFYDAVKRLVRNNGRSNMISVSQLDELLIKYYGGNLDE